MDIEMFRTKAREAGIRETIINSKCFETCLMFCIEAGEGITGIDFMKWKDEVEADVVRREAEVSDREHRVNQRENEIAWRDQFVNSGIKRLLTESNSELKARQDELRELLAKLDECETAESRDLMKRAQLFIDSVNVETKYDNTAYIAALGAILSAPGSFDCIGELKKINRKVPFEQIVAGQTHVALRTQKGGGS